MRSCHPARVGRAPLSGPAVLAGLALVLSACGTRVSHSAVVDAARGGPSAGPPAAGTTAPGSASTGAGTVGGAGPAAGSTAPSGSSPAPAGGGSGGAAYPGAGTATTVASGATASGGGGASTAGGAGGSGGDHSPLLIGSVSTLSGPAGSAQAPGVQGMQVWAAYANAHGGVDGHPVKVYVEDDGGDPSRQAADVQDLVENKHVIAFVSQWASQTQQASASYLTQHQIPVVGGDLSTPNGWGTSPMFFPEGEGAFDNVAVEASFSETAHRLVPEHRNKLGVLVCIEASVCSNAGAAARQYAPRYGLQVVYSGSGSLAAPDYTSQCLSMAQAGVQIIDAVFDANSVKRIAQSCASVGLHVPFILAFGVADHTFGSDPNFNGSIAAFPDFPFTGVSSPVADAFQAAYQQYGGGVQPDPASASGWTAGLIFARAVQVGIGTGPPSSARLLQGLWQTTDQTFGGATPPLTYTRGKPQASPHCYFTMLVTGGRWQAPNGMQPTCF